MFGDGEAKIDLAASEGDPELIYAIGMTRAELRRAMGVVKEQQAYLLKRWSEIHG